MGAPLPCRRREIPARDGRVRVGGRGCTAVAVNRYRLVRVSGTEYPLVGATLSEAQLPGMHATRGRIRERQGDEGGVRRLAAGPVDWESQRPDLQSRQRRSLSGPRDLVATPSEAAVLRPARKHHNGQHTPDDPDAEEERLPRIPMPCLHRLDIRQGNGRLPGAASKRVAHDHRPMQDLLRPISSDHAESVGMLCLDDDLRSDRLGAPRLAGGEIGEQQDQCPEPCLLLVP